MNLRYILSLVPFFTSPARQIAYICAITGHPFPSNKQPAHKPAAEYAVRANNPTSTMSLMSWEYLGSYSMISRDPQPSERSRAIAEDQARVVSMRGFIGS